jgi:hypothetical protein
MGLISGLMELDKNTTGRLSPHDENWLKKAAIQVTPKKEEKGRSLEENGAIAETI